VEPTTAGLEFADMARGLLQSAQEMIDKVSHLRAGERGTIRLMSSSNLIGGVLTQDLAEFLNLVEHRGIDIHLQEGMESQSIVNSLRDGAISLAVIWNRVATVGLENLPYRTTRLMLVTHKTHPLAQYTEIALKDCIAYDFIGMRTTRMTEIMLRRTNMLTGKPGHYRAEVWTPEAALRLIGKKLGISIISEDVAAPYAELFNLALIPLTDSWAKRSNSIVLKDESLLTPAAQLLVNFLKKKSLL
jgi:DNA-binding transcriptional LysR family regulator